MIHIDNAKKLEFEIEDRILEVFLHSSGRPRPYRKVFVGLAVRSEMTPSMEVWRRVRNQRSSTGPAWQQIKPRLIEMLLRCS